MIIKISLYIIGLICLLFFAFNNLIGLAYRKKGKKIFLISFLVLVVNLVLIILASSVFKEKEFFNNLVAIVLMVSSILSLAYEVMNRRHTEKELYNNNEFIESLNKTSWNIYYLCDKKDKIREISEGFLTELDLKKEDCIGKKAFDVFDKKIRFTKVNNQPITNKVFRDYYKEYKKKAKTEEKKEIILQNAFGQTILLNLVEKPLFINGKYYGRINIGQKKTDQAMLEVEKELSSSERALTSIQYKFITSLELTDEGIFFNDLSENSIWGNDIWVKDLGMNSNTVSILDYKALIYEEDKSFYISKLKELTPDNPTYEMRYRLKINGTYQFIYEKGKRIFEDPNSNVILGYAKRIDANYFEKTNISVIDNVLDMNCFYQDAKKLYDERHVFSLICINLTNLPEINKEFGRDVGNIVMGEYLKHIKQNFQSQSSNLYRRGGLVYYLTITDGRKMELFKKSLLTNQNSLDMTIMVGGAKVTLKVNLGIAESISDGLNPEELLNNVEKAINVSLDKNYQANCVFYKDIKNIGIR